MIAPPSGAIRHQKCQPYLTKFLCFFLYLPRYVEKPALKKQRKEHRDRMVALTFVSVLMMLIYGPLAPWFIAADRFLFDHLAAHVRNESFAEGAIVTINPVKKSPEQILDEYGRAIQSLHDKGAARIVLPNPPGIADTDELPGWAALLSGGVPVFVPREHRLAGVASHTGVAALASDNDGVLRSTRLWHLRGGEMSPSLPLAVALDDPGYTADPRVSQANITLYLSNYQPVPRFSSEELLTPGAVDSSFAGKTVFVDADPPLVEAVATLPSGQFVTPSEIAATILGNIQHHQTIVKPSWIHALEWLTPALLAIVAVLFLPDRRRSEIIVVAAAIIVGLILIEALLLLVLRMRLDLGRPVTIFLGTSFLSWWLAAEVKQESVNAFKRGRDFLSAGRLEPAFAEFRQCNPSDTLQTVMYKLSLAFEEQAKPERAEAVLNWMKQTQGATGTDKLALVGKSAKPQRLGRYVIERKIGRGAMGAVYLARDPRINRAVAVKVIPIEKEFEDEELEEARLRFYREAESAGRLTHPNIITVFDAGEDKHLAYIAMEYLPGFPLTEFCNAKRLLAPRKALELCARTAEALDYAHNQQVIHRDIKPANLLYDRKDDTLKISDFGVARMTDNNRTKTGIVLGTPMYMSPEQLNAEPLTGLSDLFSLGVTLYELLVGEVPFKATNIAVLMTKITTADPAPVSNRRPGIPPSVDAVLAKALAKRPENRFANGGEMAIALRNCARYAST